MIFKNWLDTRPKMETHDPNVYPTILGGVSRGFWTPFLDRGARSAIFWHMQCFHKRNLAMRTSKSKALQWERKDLLSRMRPKCGPNLDILRTISRYFHQNAVKSLKSTFCEKSAMLFIMEGLLYHPISIELHVLTLVLNLIDSSLSLFDSFAATFLS